MWIVLLLGVATFAVVKYRSELIALAEIAVDKFTAFIDNNF